MKSIIDKFCLKWVLISELTGIISGLLSMDGMQIYDATVQKAPLTPPGWVFAVAWTILYALMGIGVCLVVKSEKTQGKSCCVNLFIAQLIVNFFWSLIFFNAQAFAGAFVWLVLLWVLVLAMTICFSKVSPTAAWLQAPYLLWLSFAAYLNAAVWLLNS
ncbi:MAG: tryptophan-rich sensory protein [Oscillospiraceae bacterium]|nr:tryptophan-rich sensory protein [Oscillospiraceae bacterium]